MYTLSGDILRIVAEHLDPNPIVYTRLACVSREFNRVFTSDRVWQPLNVYGLNAGIHEDFKARCTTEDLQVMKGIWAHPLKPDLYTKYDIFSNLYLYLGYLTQTSGGAENEPEIIRGKYLVLRALALDESCYFVDQLSQELFQDREVAWAAVANRGCTLEHFEKFRNDKPLVLRAVTTGCPDEDRPLLYASDELKDDYDVVLAAVRQNGYSLEFASDRLRENKEIVDAAISTDASAVEFVRGVDRATVLRACQGGPYSLDLVPEEYLEDDEIVLASIKSGWESISVAPPRFRQSREVLGKLLEWHPEARGHIEKYRDRYPEYEEMWVLIQEMSR